MPSAPGSSGSKLHGIVVGVDGSPPSQSAAAWAARDAALRRLPLTVVHVLPSVEAGAWLDAAVSEDFWSGRDRRGEQIVTDAAQLGI